MIEKETNIKLNKIFLLFFSIILLSLPTRKKRRINFYRLFVLYVYSTAKTKTKNKLNRKKGHKNLNENKYLIYYWYSNIFIYWYYTFSMRFTQNSEHRQKKNLSNIGFSILYNNHLIITFVSFNSKINDLWFYRSFDYVINQFLMNNFQTLFE